MCVCVCVPVIDGPETIPSAEGSSVMPNYLLFACALSFSSPSARKKDIYKRHSKVKVLLSTKDSIAIRYSIE